MIFNILILANLITHFFFLSVDRVQGLERLNDILSYLRKKYQSLVLSSTDARFKEFTEKLPKLQLPDIETESRNNAKGNDDLILEFIGRLKNIIRYSCFHSKQQQYAHQ